MFHPEVVHTPDGARLLRNFTHKIAGCRQTWTMVNIVEEQIDQIYAPR